MNYNHPILNELEQGIENKKKEVVADFKERLLNTAQNEEQRQRIEN